MPVIESINRFEDKRVAKQEGPRTDYARLEIDLGNAAFVGTNIEIAVSGSYLAKINYNGSEGATYFRIDKRHAAAIYADEFKSVKREYDRIWLTNPNAQSGRKLILQIGQIEYAEIEPDDLKDVIDHLYGIFTIINQMSGTDRLAVAADAATDTIAAPGAGYKLEIHGYQIYETVDAAMVIADQARLEFATSGLQIWEGVSVEPGAIKEYQSIISGIRVQGAANEALTLTNADVTAGSSTVMATVFYTMVAV